MPDLLVYWRTLRHLRPIQFYGRIWFRSVRPSIDFRSAPPLRSLCGRGWVKPARRRASMVGPDHFCFLNETHKLADHGWDDKTLEKLWRYNLHYFDDLNAQVANERTNWHRALLLQWVRENPPATGTGWEPYPTSLRVVNWIKWALGGNALSPVCVKSLAVQVRWLSKRLELHLLGNHLFANAKALVFAGLFFEGSEADNWLDKGLRILEREVREQILPDGGQFELSTMYHALALEDMLDLYNLSAAYEDAVPLCWQSTIADWRNRIDPMRDWLVTMCHPDGEIGFFNDAAVGIAPAPIELEYYSTRLGFSGRSTKTPGLTRLVDSGYIRIEQGAAVILLDVGPVGPDYLPGHAHADTLSFELSLFGQRTFVNSGTSCYGHCVERLPQRGTAAHNTVVVDEQNSTEVWSSFRVGRRARPHKLRVMHDSAVEVCCAHDGYKHLRGKPEHLRRWLVSDSALVVEDQVSGRYTCAQARFHLHPAVTLIEKQVDLSEGAMAVLKLPQGQKIRMSFEGGVLREEVTTWHPEFGCSKPNLCLVVNFIRSVLRTQIEWRNAV